MNLNPRVIKPAVELLKLPEIIFNIDLTTIPAATPTSVMIVSRFSRNFPIFLAAVSEIF